MTSPRLLIAILAVSLTAFAQKKPSYTPDQATARMTLPEGFTVTQFAAEPAVVQPFAFCFDDRGRVWVCENLNYETRKSDTFKAGQVTIKLNQTGPWLLRLVHMRRCVGDAKVDWESFWSAYSFALPEAKK